MGRFSFIPHELETPMTDAPSFPKSSNSFVDDEGEKANEPKSPTVVHSEPVPISKLPEIVLVRFTHSVSPYAAGEVAAVSKAYAIAALRSGWVDLHNGGKGLGHPVPRRKSDDDTHRRQKTEASVDSSAVVAGLKESNAKLEAAVAGALEEIEELRLAISALRSPAPAPEATQKDDASKKKS